MVISARKTGLLLPVEPRPYHRKRTRKAGGLFLPLSQLGPATTSENFALPQKLLQGCFPTIDPGKRSFSPVKATQE